MKKIKGYFCKRKNKKENKIWKNNLEVFTKVQEVANVSFSLTKPGGENAA